MRVSDKRGALPHTKMSEIRKTRFREQLDNQRKSKCPARRHSAGVGKPIMIVLLRTRHVIG